MVQFCAQPQQLGCFVHSLLISLQSHWLLVVAVRKGKEGGEYFLVLNTQQFFISVLQSDLTQDISTSVLWVNNKPHMITLDYTIHVPKASIHSLPEVR